jgi:hypothetical protein
MTHVMNQIFGNEFIDELNDQLLRKQLMESQNMVECSCKNLIEVVRGDVDYKQKDEEGKVISRQAAENMAEYRVRCHACQRVFCSH